MTWCRAESGERVAVSVHVNGRQRTAEVEPRRLLVDFLRHSLGLTGTHVGCDTTSCGACTVLLNGAAVKSCTVLAVQADGQQLTTVEGLAPGGGQAPGAGQAPDEGQAPGEGQALHPLQQAFHEHHALQCGYCTPGMLMSALDLFSYAHRPTEAQIRRAIAGNICRCTGYHNIVRAIAAAAARMHPLDTGDRGERHE